MACPPPSPLLSFLAHVAFYAGLMGACLVDGEQVRPQPGGCSGGGMTRNLSGPFKGGPVPWAGGLAVGDVAGDDDGGEQGSWRVINDGVMGGL